jgi:peptide/nickel transport system substrate-binding protein
VARGVALAAAAAAALLAVSGAGGGTEQTPKRGGTLIIGARPIEEPACLNVFTCALRITVPGLLGEVLPGAFEQRLDGAFLPNLVSRADIVSKSPFVLVYRIRPEARWSDGEPVTARDFVFTDRLRKAHLPATDWHRTHVRSVRPLDAKTVRVVLRERFVDWPYLFDMVLPQHALAGEDFASAWRNRIEDPGTGRPIGSGPFLLADWKPSEQLTFVRNRRYWGPHRAYLDGFVYRFLPSGDFVGALRRGEIDMIDPVPAGMRAVAAEFHRQPAAGVTSVFRLGPFVEHFHLRVGSGGHRSLKKPLVRQALAYGLDRVEIARVVGGFLGASGAALQPADSSVFHPTHPRYQPHWRRYRHRPAEARRLLAQAGCELGQDSVYSCDGNRLTLQLVAPAGVEARRRTAELAQVQLRRIGVDLRLTYAPPAILTGQIIPSGRFDITLFAVASGLGGPVDLFGCQRQSNITDYCDRLMTGDLDEATRILDPSRRAALLNRIGARLASRAVPSFPLYQSGGFIAFRTTVRGVSSGIWDSENWWLDD